MKRPVSFPGEVAGNVRQLAFKIDGCLIQNSAYRFAYNIDIKKNRHMAVLCISERMGTFHQKFSILFLNLNIPYITKLCYDLMQILKGVINKIIISWLQRFVSPSLPKREIYIERGV